MKRTTVLIINIYIPPLDNRDQIMAALIAFLEANTKSHKQYDIILGGDFNCKRNHQIFQIIEEHYNIQVVEGNLNNATRKQIYGEIT